MAGLTKEQILAKIADRKKAVVPVEIPEWEGVVYVRHLSIGQLEEADYFRTPDGKPSVGPLLAACCATEEGEPLFTAEDASALLEVESGVAMRLFGKAADLNGLSEVSQQAGAEGFGEAQGVGTSSE